MRRYFRFTLALLFALGLIAFPAHARDAALEAIAVWGASVAPALFPFMVVLPYLTSREACEIYDRGFGRVTRLLFALPGKAASAIVTGIFSGSPAGAMAIARVARREGLTGGEAARMAGIACGSGPIYVVSGLGVALTGSAQEGWKLAIAQFGAFLITGILFRRAWRNEQPLPPEDLDERAGEKPISRAVLSILKVCGYMVMFAVGVAVADAVLGEWFEYASLVLDLPLGAAFAESEGLHRAWIAAALGSGGMCIAAQNMSILKEAGVTWPKYLAQKAVSTLLCAGLYLALGYLPAGYQLAWSPKGSEFEAAAAGIVLLTLPVTAAVILSLMRKKPTVGDS